MQSNPHLLGTILYEEFAIPYSKLQTMEEKKNFYFKIRGQFNLEKDSNN
jgi:hypothetical protein